MTVTWHSARVSLQAGFPEPASPCSGEPAASSASSEGTYRLTLPSSRASITAAPGPTAVEQASASASSSPRRPGAGTAAVSVGSSSSVPSSCSGSWAQPSTVAAVGSAPPPPRACGTGVHDVAPRASGFSSSRCSRVGRSARSALPAETVRLPADRVSHASRGHVAGSAVRTLIEATEPPPIMCHRFGVVLRDTSVQRKPATPTTTTGATGSGAAAPPVVSVLVAAEAAVGISRPSSTATIMTRTAGTARARVELGFTRPG